MWWVGGYSLGGGGDWTGTGFHVTVLPGLLTQTAPIGAYNGRSPTFTWDRDRDSHEYGIWIGQGGTTLHLAYIQASTYCDSTTCSYTPALDLSSDYYTWWVGGYSLGGGGPWNGNGFHVTVAPAAVVQLGPQGTINQSNPSFTWRRDRDTHEYSIWIGQGSTTIHQTTVQANTVCPSQTPGSTCTYTPTLNLAPGGYSWWIGGYSLGGGGPWSGMSFLVDTPVLVTRYRGQLLFNQTLNNVGAEYGYRERFDFYLDQTYNILLDLGKNSGALQYDLILADASGNTIKTARSSVNGRGILYTQLGAGWYNVYVVSNLGSNAVFNLTLYQGFGWLCLNCVQEAYTDVSLWQWTPNSGATHTFEIQAIDGNLNFNVTIYNGAGTLYTGNSTNGHLSFNLTMGSGQHWMQLNFTGAGSYTVVRR